MSDVDELVFLPEDRALANCLRDGNYRQARELVRDEHPHELRELIDALAATFADGARPAGGTMTLLLAWTTEAALLRLERRRNDHAGPVTG